MADPTPADATPADPPPDRMVPSEPADGEPPHGAAGDEAGQALDSTEREQVARRAPPAARVVHETIRREGEDELARSLSALALSAFAAGLSMGASVLAQALLTANLPNEIWRPVIASFGYTVGFVIVVLARQQLFTENTVTVILPLLTRRDRETLWRVGRLWVIVLAANLLGTLVVAWALTSTDALAPAAREAVVAIGHAAFEGDIASRFVRGIFAGWLIALMVWVLPAADSAKVAVIVIITYVLGLGALTHVIAGSIEVLGLVTTGALPFSAYAIEYLVPALLGNVLGGVALVAVLNHGQVAAEGATKADGRP